MMGHRLVRSILKFALMGRAPAAVGVSTVTPSRISIRKISAATAKQKSANSLGSRPRRQPKRRLLRADISTSPVSVSPAAT
jgi:hypothetical protein